MVRTTVQALAAVLGGAQSLHTNSRDEALALPTAEAARLALRTQQILAYEAGVTETPDPLGRQLLRRDADRRARGGRARPTSTRSRRWAARSRAIEGGFQQRQIQERPTGSSARSSGRPGRRRRQPVPRRARPHRRRIQQIDPDGERRQVEGLRRVRAERDPAAWDGGAARGSSDAARGERQPAAADHRGGQGLRDGRRDLRPAARRVGRAPRADHGLMSRRAQGTWPHDRDPGRWPTRFAPARPRSTTSAVVVRDLDAALGFYRDILGLRARAVLPIPADRVRIAFLPVGESKIELVEPTDDTTGVARFLATQGRGLPPRLLRGGRTSPRR